MANTVNIEIEADGSKASGNFDKVRKSVMAVSAAVAGIGLALVKIGDEFTEATTNIKAGTGATGAELESLKDSFKEVAAGVPQDFAQVSTAIADVNTELGLTGLVLESTTKDFLDFSRVMGVDASMAIKQVSAVMDGFGVTADDSSRALDIFTVAAQKSGVPIESLTMQAQKFAPTLRGLDLSLEESVALLAEMGSAGVDVNRIMPQLSVGLSKIAASGATDAKEAFSNVIREIGDATTQMEAINQASVLFGDTGGVKVADAVRQGSFEFGEMQVALENSSGALQNVAEDSLTASDKLTMLKDNVKLAIEPLAGFMANIGPIVFMLPAFISGISALAGIQAVQTAVAWLQTAAMTALNVAMGPIGLIILGIALAIGAGILIWKNWDAIMETVRATLKKVDDFLTDTFGPTWIYIKDMVVNAVEAIKEIFKGLFALFTGDIDGFKEHMSNALGFLQDAWDSFIDGIWKPFDDFMTNKFGGAWDLAKGIVSGVIDVIKGYFDGLVEALQGAWDIIVGLFTGDTEKIKEGFKGIVNGILTMFNGLIKAVNRIGFTLPDWLGGKSFSLNIPEIPKLAEGGIVNRPTLAMIGEAGPEAVVPLNKASGGLGGGVVVNVMMPEGGTVIMDDESTMQRFGDFITREVRQALRTQGGF